MESAPSGVVSVGDWASAARRLCGCALSSGGKNEKPSEENEGRCVPGSVELTAERFKVTSGDKVPIIHAQLVTDCQRNRDWRK